MLTLNRRRRRRILVLTRIWPSADRPSLGTFVRDRVRGIDHIRVVHPGRRSLPWPLLYGAMFARALATPGIAGIEAHVLVPTGLVGWAVARLRRMPIVVYSHGGDVREWPRLRAPRRWATRFVARHADRVVTNSADTARWIRQLGAEPVVAPPGIDLARFSPSPRPKEGGVLYLGGRNRRKGWEIARDLADTLAGPWLREVDPADVPDLIRRHDVVLVPSVDEPFGLVALEAIACGRWVVANDVGGLREIVVDGVNGTLVRDGDFAAALANVPDYDPFTLARTVERYSVERWQARLDDVWADLFASTGGR